MDTENSSISRAVDEIKSTLLDRMKRISEQIISTECKRRMATARANVKAKQHTGVQQENWWAIYFAYFSFCIKALL